MPGESLGARAEGQRAGRRFESGVGVGRRRGGAAVQAQAWRQVRQRDRDLKCLEPTEADPDRRSGFGDAKLSAGVSYGRQELGCDERAHPGAAIGGARRPASDNPGR